MERTPAKRSSRFLLELMIAILFFCLASAVCVQIFVKAHTTSRETQELNTALEKVSGYTELFLADALTEDTEVFYDADWQECSKDEASYEIVIRVEPDGKLLHGTFTVQRLSGEQPEEIYSVETDRMTGTDSQNLEVEILADPVKGTQKVVKWKESASEKWEEKSTLPVLGSD